jgi:Protein of unknown function (DUF3866)
MVTAGGVSIRALAYPALVGSPRVGDRVLLNVTALEAGLGTGGYALVVAIPDRLPDDPDIGGHIMKSRYTPLQVMTASAEEQGSEYHELLESADSLDAMPVVVADLHSALPAILAGLRSSFGTRAAAAARGDAPPSPPGGSPRVAYVMTDGGALPAWFSRTIAGLREAGWLAATITTGQSFGGDLEAVTVHSGLLTARHAVGADVAIVAQGPGNLGTGTKWGYSGVAAGEAVNAAAALDGRPVASLRVSFADPRERHQGVSHHSLTAYGRVALAGADVVVPALQEPQAARVASDVAPLAARHRLITVPVNGLEEALRASPVALSTMGRSLDEDLEYFLAAAAAGAHAARLCVVRLAGPRTARAARRRRGYRRRRPGCRCP